MVALSVAGESGRSKPKMNQGNSSSRHMEKQQERINKNFR